MPQNLEPIKETTTILTENNCVCPDDIRGNADQIFFQRWLKSPLTIASLTPSSPSLARAMAEAVPKSDGLVVELGAGTGAITDALLAAHVAAEDVVIVERDHGFYQFLRHRYSEINIVQGNALDLTQLLKTVELNKPVRAVVSGLPLLAMSENAQANLIRQVMEITDGVGPLIQFSYSLFSPLKKSVQKKLKINAQCLRQVWRNLPPAKVWCYKPENE